MTGERELFFRGEDADVNAALTFDLGCAREDEGGFGEVGLAGERLHFVVGEAARVGKDGERVAFKRLLGEDVDHGIRERARALDKLTW